MKLHVEVIEARGLRASGTKGIYVRLQLGNTRAKSSFVHDSANPSWNEDFSFHVDDLQTALRITVWDQERFSDNFLGQVKLPVSAVLTAERQTITPTWYRLEKRSKKSKAPVSGEIRLGLSLYGRTYSSKTSSSNTSDLSTSTSLTSTPEHPHLFRTSSSESLWSSDSRASPLSSTASSTSLLPYEARKSDSFLDLKKERALSVKEPPSRGSFIVRLSSLFSKAPQSLSISTESSSEKVVDYTTRFEDSDSNEEDENLVPLSFFEDDGQSVPATEDEVPPPLPGGILLDQKYAVSAKKLNAFIFKPGSQFVQDLVTLQKTTDMVEGPWRTDGVELFPKRVTTYMKAPSKLVKSVKAIEDQIYLKADDRGFVVLISASTPDVPYGSTFRVEVQYCIMAGADLPSGEKTSRLRISWKVHFISSTIIKGMIESGARQGLQESCKQFAEVLENHAKPINLSLSTATTLPELVVPKSDWELAKEYFFNLRVCLTIISLVIMLLHIYLSKPFAKSGLELWRLDLPDTLRELITSALLGIQIEHTLKMVNRFLQARVCRVSDHGVKAKGDGWLLSATLVNGESLPASDETGLADPYVVFTCNGKTRTSSVKLQTLNPEWQERFEFDATEEAPSTMYVEVFDFEGPFTEAGSLGHAEINFLKKTPDELANLWVPLQGKNALASGAKLHLRIFLTNTKEADNVNYYIEKVEKEVGRKIARRSPQKNSSFQRIFSLPSEEFLINDFACALKRKVPIQGRLFLSPRVLGFYSNIFGRKTRFSILWEDIDEIRESSSALGTVGMLLNPMVLVFTKKGRAMDARLGAKSVDVKGRFKFQFQSFVRFKPAYRTITALWKNRMLSPEQQMEILADMEEHDGEFAGDEQADASETFLGEEAKLSEVYSTRIPLSVDSMILMYHKESLDEKIAQKTGCLNYSTTPWEPVGDKEGALQRQINYKLSRRICPFGSSVSSIQQRSMQEDGQAYIIEEVLRFHDVPFGDYYQIHVRKEVENLSISPPLSVCRVFLGIAWQKSTMFQNRISKNIFERYTKHLTESLDILVKEVLSLKEENTYVVI